MSFTFNSVEAAVMETADRYAADTSRCRHETLALYRIALARLAQAQGLPAAAQVYLELAAEAYAKAGSRKAA